MVGFINFWAFILIKFLFFPETLNGSNHYRHWRFYEARIFLFLCNSPRRVFAGFAAVSHTMVILIHILNFTVLIAFIDDPSQCNMRLLSNV